MKPGCFVVVVVRLTDGRSAVVVCGAPVVRDGRCERHSKAAGPPKEAA